MKNIEDINKAAIKKIVANKKITDFSPGDTIKVGVKIVEGKRERIQYFSFFFYVFFPKIRSLATCYSLRLG